jgi:hypothetical protein
MRIAIRTQDPKYIHPLEFRVTSDDGDIDKFAGVPDCTDTEAMIKLFKNMVKALEEIKEHEREQPNGA